MAVLLAGCTWGRFPLLSGTYSSDATDGALKGASLSIDTTALRATLTLESQPPVEMMFKGRAWTNDCYTNVDHAEVESWQIVPDPFVVADLSLPEATLTTACVESAGVGLAPACRLTRANCPVYGYRFVPEK